MQAQTRLILYFKFVDKRSIYEFEILFQTLSIVRQQEKRKVFGFATNLFPSQVKSYETLENYLGVKLTAYANQSITTKQHVGFC